MFGEKSCTSTKGLFKIISFSFVSIGKDLTAVFMS